MSGLRDGQVVGWTGPMHKTLPINVGGGDQAIAPTIRGLLCSGSGNVVVVLEDDADSVATRLTLALTAGVPLTGYSIGLIKQTGTTATGIVGLY